MSLGCSAEYPASKLVYQDFLLRPVGVPDAPEFVAAIAESRAELGAFLPFAHQEQTLESQLKRLQCPDRDPSFGLFRQGIPRLLGTCGLHPRSPLNPNGIEIGFWTRTSESGRGLATLMTRLLIIYCVEALAKDRLQILHNVDNLASQRVIERCGFKFEGRIRNCLPPAQAHELEGGMSAGRDCLQYSLLPEESRQLDWYQKLRTQIRVFDLLGVDLGFFWT